MRIRLIEDEYNSRLKIGTRVQLVKSPGGAKNTRFYVVASHIMENRDRLFTVHELSYRKNGPATLSATIYGLPNIPDEWQLYQIIRAFVPKKSQKEVIKNVKAEKEQIGQTNEVEREIC